MVALLCCTKSLTDSLQCCRDGPDQCFYEGIDCSADFLQLARQNLVEACPKLQPAKVGTICQLYMDGLREARSRCAL